MIIDCHGHYTTAPKALQTWRDAQIAGLKDSSAARAKGSIAISDDAIRESLEEPRQKRKRCVVKLTAATSNRLKPTPPPARPPSKDLG
jgi:hypothetical protein